MSKKSVVFRSAAGPRRLTIPRQEIRSWLTNRMASHHDYEMEFQGEIYGIGNVLYDPDGQRVIDLIETAQRAMYGARAVPNEELGGEVARIAEEVQSLRDDLTVTIGIVRRMAFDINTAAKLLPVPKMAAAEEDKAEQLEL